MNELNKINNENFLKELSERIKKGEIRVEGDKLVSKIEQKPGGYFAFSIPLNIDVGNLVNVVIRELKEELRVVRTDKEMLESRS